MLPQPVLKTNSEHTERKSQLTIRVNSIVLAHARERLEVGPTVEAYLRHVLHEAGVDVTVPPDAMPWRYAADGFGKPFGSVMTYGEARRKGWLDTLGTLVDVMGAKAQGFEPGCSPEVAEAAARPAAGRKGKRPAPPAASADAP